MSEQRESKRVRQACLNCRRKKTRCSGERPVCAFCARLNQPCRYEDGPAAEPSVSSQVGSLQEDNANLAARVALLETRLSLLDPSGLETSLHPFTTSTQDSQPSHTDLFGVSPEYQRATSDSSFATIPDIQVLRSIADTYFSCCEGQPYSYFYEGTFRQRLEEGALPSYLTLAFMAVAVRFSEDPFFAGRQNEAMYRYAAQAWAVIIDQSFSDNHALDLHIVQAANMLGMVDFIGSASGPVVMTFANCLTAGRSQLAWVKIGLSIRFAQTLRLDKEPGEDSSPMEQEEHRRTFWSVYLLDRLVSCGRNRPPTLLDNDCTIQLPCAEDQLRYGLSAEPPTLATMNEIPDVVSLKKTDHFALTVWMASVLGCAVRWCFRHSSAGSHLPWDSRSEFARINGVLLSFETYSEASASDSTFEVILDRDFRLHDSRDRSMACHFVYSHVLYHVNQCLLHHPFLLRQHLRTYRAKIPPSFLRAAIRKSREHAISLTLILRALRQHGCNIHPSFYGYAAVIAGVIHRLHAKEPHPGSSAQSEEYWRACIAFLDQEPVYWESYKRMSNALKEFDPAPSVAEDLLSPRLNSKAVNPVVEEMLWRVCDYNSLSDSTLPAAPLSQTTPSQSFNVDDSAMSSDFEEMLIRMFPPSQHYQKRKSTSTAADANTPGEGVATFMPETFEPGSLDFGSDANIHDPTWNWTSVL